MQLYYQRRGTSTWTLLTTRTSSSTGLVSFAHKPAWSLTYRWQYAGTPTLIGTAGGSVAVSVRMTVSAALSKPSIRLGGSVTMSGKVLPSHAGSTVILQRKSGSTWVTVGTAKLSVTSAYSITFKPSTKGSKEYRVLKAADGDHVASVSAPRVLKVI